jgi:hypothetical protein
MIVFRLVATLILVAVGASALAADRIEMTVTRDKEPIGTHSFSFIKDGARLHVDTKVEIAVKLAFVTVYRMLKTSRETWKNGTVVAYDATIDDNGTVTKITARPDGKNMTVDGPDGRVTAPLGTMISGYWSERCVGQTLLIDSSDGVLRRVATGKAARETLRAGDREIPVRHYRMTGDLKRDLWYGEDGRLVRMREVARDGSVIVTELTSLGRKD